MALPPEILALVEMHPVEDLMLALLPDKLAGIRVQSLIEDDQQFPMVLVRRSGDWGEWKGDPRFLDACQLSVQLFLQGIDADQDAANLGEAVRVLMRDSRNEVVPGKGHITKSRMIRSPRRLSDWATATGPVQYADLPSGVVRYEVVFEVEIRKPLTASTP